MFCAKATSTPKHDAVPRHSACEATRHARSYSVHRPEGGPFLSPVQVGQRGAAHVRDAARGTGARLGEQLRSSSVRRPALLQERIYNSFVGQALPQPVQWNGPTWLRRRGACSSKVGACNDRRTHVQWAQSIKADLLLGLPSHGDDHDLVKSARTHLDSSSLRQRLYDAVQRHRANACPLPM